MFVRKKKIDKLNTNLDNINKILTRNEILSLVELLGNKKQLLIRNLLSGISKGVGIGIGVTLITALIVFLLQRIVRLNLPIIGEYVSDIIEIVKSR